MSRTRTDLHGRISALLDLWRQSQRSIEAQAEQKRHAGDGEWLTGIEDRGRTMIAQLEETLHGSHPPAKRSLPTFDPASDEDDGQWYYPNAPDE